MDKGGFGEPRENIDLVENAPYRISWAERKNNSTVLRQIEESGFILGLIIVGRLLSFASKHRREGVSTVVKVDRDEHF